jgi:GTP-binding protein
MLIKSATFVSSAAQLNQCPPENKPEFAFIGRSNVGKSSLINMLVGQKGLAKTSSTPGKTQLLNYFLINERWFLVDLPGYGFAKVSKDAREKWEKRLFEYLTKRENLYCVFILVDSRLEPQRNDLDMINWLGEHQVPMAILFTKTDKLKPRELENNCNTWRIALSKYWDDLPTMMITSAENKSGKDEVLDFIEQYVDK